MFAQENIVLKGIVVGDSIESTSINIINMTQSTGTTSSSDGTFNIKVKENDTLLFSSVQFETLKIEINAEIYKRKFLRIQLKKAIIELEEVPISDISLTGNLSSDLANLEVFNQADVGFPLQDNNRPSGIDKQYRSLSYSDLFLIINTLNGKIKRLKEARKIIQFDKIVDKGINAVSTSFFTTELSVPKNEILNFVNYCAQNKKFRLFVSEEATLEIIKFYYQSAPQFLMSISKNKL